MSAVVEVMRNKLDTALLLCEPPMCLWTALNTIHTKLTLQLETAGAATRGRQSLIDRLALVTKARDRQWERVAVLYYEVQKAKRALEVMERVLEWQQIGGSEGDKGGFE